MPRAARSRRTPSSRAASSTIQDPFGAVYALDGATGARLWKWTPTYEAGFGVGSGSRKPGVAIGEGKVFAGLADGQLYGLNQTDGSVLWSTEVTPWRTGGKTSSAPIYVNGMVLVGDSAGDNGGSSATMQAFTANNGKRIWSWSVIPTVGQPGYKTWSANSAGYTNNITNGGGSMWESPLIDPKLNLAIFGTGNPVPWNSRGQGMNLYTDSIVALNLYTGQLVWYYQTTHHDLWDSDLPNNGVMFTAKYNIKGKMVSRPGVAFVNKYGMTFILDRETGKPLLPIPEVKVPQSTALDVNTWPTQPIPMADNVLGQQAGRQQAALHGRQPDADERVRPVRDGDRAGRQAVQDRLRLRPVRHDAVRRAAVRDDGLAGELVQPGEPDVHHLRRDRPGDVVRADPGGLAGQGRVRRHRRRPPRRRRHVHLQQGQLRLAERGDGQAGVEADLGRAVLQRLDEHRSGHHVHRPSRRGQRPGGDGYLEAYDTKTGASLWKSPPDGRPVGAAPVTYTANGKQYVSVAVGGQSHNDVSRPLGLTNPARLRGRQHLHVRAAVGSSSRVGGADRRPPLNVDRGDGPQSAEHLRATLREGQQGEGCR